MITILRAAALACLCAAAGATETENLDLRIVPAPGAVTVDGDARDWDLSGGVFACGDVENARDRYGVWVHAMWDQKNLYVFARWLDDTPLSNPGSIKGDYGFNGDCLQVRVLTAPADQIEADANPAPQDARDRDDPAKSRTTHLTCWRDRDGLDTVNISWGRRFNEGGGEGKDKGAQQAFRVHADQKGYDQELAIPWAVLSRDGWAPSAGARIAFTIEPNFTVAGGARLTIKDIFKSGVGIDRVFTFQGPNSWGYATLEAKGGLPPRAVRLSDRREFPVRMSDAGLVADWSGLERKRGPDGFKSVRFTLDRDACVSLNLFRADGSVARQLLTNAPYPKGDNEVLWDGLTTPSAGQPGEPVASGEYTWGGLVHDPITLKLRGWAGNSGEAPWGNAWGADHGDPCCCASDGERVYIGWSGGEGAKPLLACDLEGHVLWKNIRGGLASASLVAADGTTVFAWNDIGAYATKGVYRVDAKTGAYTEWSALHGTDLVMSALWLPRPDGAHDAEEKIPERPTAMTAGAGKLWLTFDGNDAVIAVDVDSGKPVKRYAVKRPGDCEMGPDGRLYVVSENSVLALDPVSGAVARIGAPELGEKDWISAIAVDRAGDIYCGVRGARHHIAVIGKDGARKRIIGRAEGRPLLGPWQPDGVLNVGGLALDAKGRLWVAEEDGVPKRVSVFDSASGAFVHEFFGASSYGAIGGAIDPTDPYRMIGQGCEWRIDPKTGRSTLLGVVTRDGMGASRFGFGPDQRLYLAVTPGFLHDGDAVRIFERRGDGDYALRTMLWRDGDKPDQRTVSCWADANGDGQRQDGEVRSWHDALGGWLQGWYMAMTPDLAFCAGNARIAPVAWTDCHAPRYDLDQATKLPGLGGFHGGMGAQQNHGSVDGRLVLWNAAYGESRSTMDCFDVATGKLLWQYPSNFVGVHGSHHAPAAQLGMIRGAYDIVGAAKLPDPVGNLWVVPTNKGEWHVLTEKGYYLTALFEGDPMKWQWPKAAAPGVDVTHCPPGAGEEAFGGSLTQGVDGAISVQVGHVAFWNVAVEGLETIRALPGGAVTISGDDAKTAAVFRERLLQVAAGADQLTIARATPRFTGDLDQDFAGAKPASFQRAEHAGVRVALAWDDANLYAGWQVEDDTPWVNGADAPEFMYARGDTVDLQLATDPAADPNRDDGGAGDLRLSIGRFRGKDVAVLYRHVARADDQHPKTFSSGVVHEYAMQSVTMPDDVRIVAHPDPAAKRYVVEATIPLARLGVSAKPGLRLRGDIGVTHGNPAGDDTVLRSYWHNLGTGLVSDEVYELRMTPKDWGELRLGE